jgi:diguanylate cyclase (GGDEF)-like protein
MRPSTSTWFSLVLAAVLGIIVSVQVVGLVAQRRADETWKRRVRLARDIEQVRYYDELLTMSVRLAATSGDRTYRDRYEVAAPKLEEVLHDALRLVDDDVARTALKRTDAANTALVALEERAFERLAAGDREGAYRLVTSPRYDNLKAVYWKGMTEGFDRLDLDIRQQSDRAQNWQVGTLVAGPMAALLLLVGLYLVVRSNLRAVKRQGLHDALTGLPNRLLFADRAAHALAAASRTGAQPTVMMLDLDRFKEVNDTLGHHAGDVLLVQVAARLGKVMRPSDTVARFGGDEFAVLLPEVGPVAATGVAERMLKALEDPFNLDGVAVSVEASMGIASASGADQLAGQGSASEQVAELLRQADIAMYQAKTDRCGYTQFTADSDDGATTHLAVLGELRAALERDELVMHYQPKTSVVTGELVGVEALVRWQHPTRGLLGPDEFIDLAEGTTLIHRLTTVVIEKALTLTRTWLDQGVRLPVAVNVSARTLLDRGFPAAVADQLDRAGVPAKLLCIEITESTIMADPERAIGILRELRAMGVRLSVDDFGTGYSSMSYLKILPVDELKVDRSFVRDMTREVNDTILVQSAIDLGHNLGLAVVAEGVEDADTLGALKTLGADIIQGYLLGRPMPEDLLRQWLTDRLGANATPTGHPTS